MTTIMRLIRLHYHVNFSKIYYSKLYHGSTQIDYTATSAAIDGIIKMIGKGKKQ